MALKIGGPSVKALESAIKLSKGAAVGSKEYKAATATIEKLAQEKGVIGSFLQMLLIVIRDIIPDEKNPFEASEVKNNIMKELWELIGEERVKVIVIPDIESINFGRGVGYDIIEHIPPQEVSDISATKIREQLKQEGKL